LQSVGKSSTHKFIAACKQNRETVVGSERFNAHESTVQGHVVAKRAGTYILQWDNTYSYMKSKALTYQVRTACATRPSPHSPSATHRALIQIFLSPPSESDTTA
jgi:hypothetical protein